MSEGTRHRGTIPDDVIIPAGQSLLIGAGVAVGTFTVTVTVTVWQGWPWWTPFAVGGACGGVSFAVSSVLLTLDHRRLLWAAENALELDLDQDNEIGKPEPGPDTQALRVELFEDHGNRQRMAFVDLPHKDKLPRFARGVLNGKGTGSPEWVTKGPLSRKEWKAIRNAMIEQGLAVWRDPEHRQQGWELNAAGRAVMRRIAERSK